MAVIGWLVKQDMEAKSGIAKTNERVARLETENKVFWTVVQPHLAGIIHQSVAPRRDELVERFVTGEGFLTDEEWAEMILLLQKDASDSSRDPAKRMASALLAARAESVFSRKKEMDEPKNN